MFCYGNPSKLIQLLPCWQANNNHHDQLPWPHSTFPHLTMCWPLCPAAPPWQALCTCCSHFLKWSPWFHCCHSSFVIVSLQMSPLWEASSVIPCHSLSHYSVYVLQSSFEMHGNLWFTYSLEQKLCESSTFLCLVHCHNCMSWNKAGTKGAE